MWTQNKHKHILESTHRDPGTRICKVNLTRYICENKHTLFHMDTVGNMMRARERRANKSPQALSVNTPTKSMDKIITEHYNYKQHSHLNNRNLVAVGVLTSSIAFLYVYFMSPKWLHTSLDDDDTPTTTTTTTTSDIPFWKRHVTRSFAVAGGLGISVATVLWGVRRLGQK